MKLRFDRYRRAWTWTVHNRRATLAGGIARTKRDAQNDARVYLDGLYQRACSLGRAVLGCTSEQLRREINRLPFDL